MKFTAAFVTAAHTAARKIADVTLTYRQKLGRAMKTLFAAAKAPVVKTKEFEVGYSKVKFGNATIKQYNYLEILVEKVGGEFSLNASQFIKHVSSWEASEMIDACLAGYRVAIG